MEKDERVQIRVDPRTATVSLTFPCPVIRWEWTEGNLEYWIKVFQGALDVLQANRGPQVGHLVFPERPEEFQSQ